MISWGADHMIARCAIVIVILLAFRPAVAESLNADAARGFVVGKLFAFNCFDGSRGAGRIYDDGSVVGTIQFQGVGPVEWVLLPSGCDFSRREGYRSKAASGAALAQAYGVVTGELRKGAGLCAGWRLLSSEMAPDLGTG